MVILRPYFKKGSISLHAGKILKIPIMICWTPFGTIFQKFQPPTSKNLGGVLKSVKKSHGRFCKKKREHRPKGSKIRSKSNFKQANIGEMLKILVCQTLGYLGY